MAIYISELYRYRDLLYVWIVRNLRIRYKQSLLGVLWAILQPLALMLLFVFVFSFILEVPSDGIPYPIFSYTALLPWTFFATSLTFGVNSLVGNMSLVTKIYFPREILPLGAMGAALVDFAIASVVLLILMLAYQVPLQITLLWLPLIILVQMIFTAAVILPASAMTVFYRDVRFAVPLGIQIWMYATPIIYPISSVPEKLLPFYVLNPMVGIIEAYRNVILRGLPPDPRSFGIAAIIAVILLLVGYPFFKRREGVMPDVI